MANGTKLLVRYSGLAAEKGSVAEVDQSPIIVRYKPSRLNGTDFSAVQNVSIQLHCKESRGRKRKV